MQIELVAGGFSKESGVGIERYSWELLNRFQKKGISVKPVSSNPSRKRYALAIYAVTKVPIATFVRLRNSIVVHATDPSSAFPLPFTGRISVVTFHDLMPLLLGKNYGMGDRVFSRIAYNVARACKAIITVSQQTRQELIQYLNVPVEKIHVIPLGVSEEFRILEGTEKEEETIGYVGDINPRKKLDFLLEGFALLRKERPSAKLMIIGSNVAEYLDAERQRLLRLVEKLGIKPNVTFTGRVSERRLIEFYNRMKILVLPSEYEGFGLPILEAERCGTPAMIRKGVRISPEVSSACLTTSTPVELAQTILDLLADPKNYRRKVEIGVEHSTQFTWENCIQRTILLYNTLLNST